MITFPMTGKADRILQAFKIFHYSRVIKTNEGMIMYSLNSLYTFVYSVCTETCCKRKENVS